MKNEGRGYSATRLLLAAAIAAGLAGAGIALAAGGGANGQPAPTPAELKASRLKAQDARGAALNAPAPAAPSMAAPMALPGGVPNYFGPEPNWAWSPPLQKFVTRLPGLGAASSNEIGQYIPVAVPDTTVDPAADYYEIGLVQYAEQMHTGLLPTTLRGYVQLNGLNAAASAGAQPGVDASLWPVPPHYLGPVIVASGGLGVNAAAARPVRVLFRNLLPLSGSGGALDLPVDTSVMGSGMFDINFDPQTKLPTAQNAGEFAQNRGTLHLHGGFTPWVSDGTAHQWTAPAGDATTYPKGASTAYVPDMWFDPLTHAFLGVSPTAPATPNGPATNNPGPGAMTFYYPNQQSARLMFYHDHAMGITRLNVYDGEAAGYLLTDPTETALTATGGVLAAAGLGTPLVIQDKTFLNHDAVTGTLATDPTWPVPVNAAHNDLWYPHVYMPNQNPADISGANMVGRWDWGPWFWPPWPTQTSAVPLNMTDPVTGDPMFAPGVPDVSAVPEAMMDTPVVNGTAYPYMDVPAGVVRFRVLNACNDRMLNLGIYVADPAHDTEVRTVPAVKSPAVFYPAGTLDAAGNDIGGQQIVFPAAWTANDTIGQPGDILDGRGSGVPDPVLMGPAMIQIGNEGGFLPEPVVIGPMTSISKWPATDPDLLTAVQMPTGVDRDVRSVTVGNVKEHGLLLGPAERADILVDFTRYAGKTLILYNDAPAPLPAPDSRLDYYTDGFDQTAIGGTTPTAAGVGPNTRTVMQFRVGAAGSGSTLDLAALKNAFAGVGGVFATSQDPIIVPQGGPAGATWNGSNSGGYNSAYGATFPTGTAAFVRLPDTSMTFSPLDLTTATKLAASPVTMPLQPKAIAEEFEDVAGRMQTSLGVEVKFTNGQNQTTIWYGFHDPVASVLASPDPSVSISTLAVASDGTQIWKVTHNGVDTHPIHFHQFNVQVLNRVHWDNMIQPPDPNELGWKETVRMDPLEDIIVAARSRVPSVPFDLPNSYRPFDPTMSTGVDSMRYDITVNGAPFTVNAANQTVFKNVDTAGNPVTILNRIANYGWEYVWHCHILGHEEQDMMRPTAVAVPPRAATGLAVAVVKQGTSKLANFSWTDASLNETAWVLEGSNDLLAWAPEATIPSTTEAVKGTATASIALTPTTPTYHRIVATDTVGSGIAGYPSATASAAPTNTVTTLEAPSNLTGTLQKPAASTQVKLTWTDNSLGETGFNVYRSANGNGFAQVGTAPAGNNTGGNITFVDATVASGSYYTYQVRAANAVGTSDPSNSFTIAVKVPNAPASASVTAVRAGSKDNATVTWVPFDAANSTAYGPATGFTVQASTSSTFPATSSTITANVGNVTSYTFVGLSRNTKYYFRVRATNPIGSSANATNANPFPLTTP